MTMADFVEFIRQCVDLTPVIGGTFGIDEMI